MPNPFQCTDEEALDAFTKSINGKYMRHLKNDCKSHHMIISDCCGLQCGNCLACKCSDKSLLERIGNDKETDDWVRKAETGKPMRII